MSSKASLPIIVHNQLSNHPVAPRSSGVSHHPFLIRGRRENVRSFSKHSGTESNFPRLGPLPKASPKGERRGKPPQLRISMPSAALMVTLVVFGRNTEVMTEVWECDGRGATSHQRPQGPREDRDVICLFLNSDHQKNPDSFAGFSQLLYVSSVSEVQGGRAHGEGAGPIEKTVSAKIYQNGFLDIHRVSVCSFAKFCRPREGAADSI